MTGTEPYVKIRYMNGFVHMDEQQYLAAVISGAMCPCGDCIDCAAIEHAMATDHPFVPVHLRKD
jgi:hypothetical protein